MVHQIENNFPLSRLKEIFRTVFLKSTCVDTDGKHPLNLIVETLIRSFEQENQSTFVKRNFCPASVRIRRTPRFLSTERWWLNKSRSHREVIATMMQVSTECKEETVTRITFAFFVFFFFDTKQPIYLFHKN